MSLETLITNLKSFMILPVEFESSESVLRGYFFPASGDFTFATVLFLQGFPGTEGDELICERLARGGANVLTFNFGGDHFGLAP